MWKDLTRFCRATWNVRQNARSGSQHSSPDSEHDGSWVDHEADQGMEKMTRNSCRRPLHKQRTLTFPAARDWGASDQPTGSSRCWRTEVLGICPSAASQTRMRLSASHTMSWHRQMDACVKPLGHARRNRNLTADSFHHCRRRKAMNGCSPPAGGGGGGGGGAGGPTNRPAVSLLRRGAQ